MAASTNTKHPTQPKFGILCVQKNPKDCKSILVAKEALLYLDTKDIGKYHSIEEFDMYRLNLSGFDVLKCFKPITPPPYNSTTSTAPKVYKSIYPIRQPQSRYYHAATNYPPDSQEAFYDLEVFDMVMDFIPVATYEQLEYVAEYGSTLYPYECQTACELLMYSKYLRADTCYLLAKECPSLKLAKDFFNLLTSRFSKDPNYAEYLKSLKLNGRTRGICEEASKKFMSLKKYNPELAASTNAKNNKTPLAPKTVDDLYLKTLMEAKEIIKQRKTNKANKNNKT